MTYENFKEILISHESEFTPPFLLHRSSEEQKGRDSIRPLKEETHGRQTYANLRFS